MVESEAEYLSVAEAHEKYNGEVVLMRVTTFDLDMWPSYGQILAHSPDPSEDYYRIVAEAPHNEHLPLYQFHADRRRLRRIRERTTLFPNDGSKTSPYYIGKNYRNIK